MDASAKPPTKTDIAIATLKQRMSRIKEQLTELDTIEPKLALGIEVLQTIYRDFGEQGLIDFAQWAVHPASGFLPLSIENSPLPTSVGQSIANVLEKINTKIDELANDIQKPRSAITLANKQPRDSFRYSRRTALGGALIGGMLVGGVGGYITSSPEDDSATRIIRIASGALAISLGVGMAAATSYYIVNNQKKMHCTLVEPQVRHITVDQAADTASKAMEVLLSPPQKGARLSASDAKRQRG
jgi:hypothetical protein